MDVVALVIFLGVIILAFVRKINVGILAVAAGVIAVRLFGMTDKDLIGGFSSSMFVTLVGITLLFATINATGALDLLARKIIDEDPEPGTVYVADVKDGELTIAPAESSSPETPGH